MASADIDLEESIGFPSELVLLLLVTGFSSFLLGWLCSRRSTVPGPQPVTSSAERWERLARRALRFISRRRRASLALAAYSDSTLRNSEGSRPNKARQAVRARAATPARILHEGPALVRDGPHRGGAGANPGPSRRPGVGGSGRGSVNNLD